MEKYCDMRENRLGMSLVLTCYNRQEYIREAILSVFA